MRWPKTRFCTWLAAGLGPLAAMSVIAAPLLNDVWVERLAWVAVVLEVVLLALAVWFRCTERPRLVKEEVQPGVWGGPFIH
jgi:hypothetical protein